MAKYLFISRVTPVDVAAALGLDSTKVIVTTEPDGDVTVEVPAALTAAQQTALAAVMGGRRAKGRIS